MILQMIDKEFSIYKVKEIPVDLLKQQYVFLSVTDSEVSLITESSLVPEDVIIVEGGWSCFRIAEDASFDKYGMIAYLANIIAGEKTSTLVVGTFDTDYLFIKNERFEQVKQALVDDECVFI